MMRQVQQDPPVPLRKINPQISRDLETICEKCLEKEPDKRYASAAALAEDLRRFLGGLPIKARPIGRLEHSWKWVKRYPAIAALFAVLLIASPLLAVKWVQATYATRRAEMAESDAIAQRDASRQREAQLTFDKGLELCIAGKADEGLHWMTRSLELDPDVSPDFRRLVGTNIASWSQQVPALESILPHKTKVMTADFSPDTRWLATGTVEGVVGIWDCQSWQLVHRLPPCEQNFTKAFHFSPDSSTLFTTWGIDDTSRPPGGSYQWDVATGRLIRQYDSGYGVAASALSPDGSLFATGDFTGKLRIWDTTTGQLNKTMVVGNGSVDGLVFSNEQEIVVISDEGTDGQPTGIVSRWDLRNGAQVGESIRREDTRFISCTLSPDRQSLLIGSTDTRIPIVNLVDWTVDDSQFFHSTGVERGAFYADGSMIVVAGFDGTDVSVFDADSGELIRQMDLGSRVRHPAFSSDGTFLAVGCVGEARVLRIDNWYRQRLWETNRRQLDEVTAWYEQRLTPPVASHGPTP